MGNVFRRSYRDKKTGRTKRVRTYSIKLQDAAGTWVTEATDAVQKHVAQRFLRERELQVQQQLPSHAPQASPVPESAPGAPSPASGPVPAVTLEELRDLYLPAVRIRLKPSTSKMYAEVLGFIMPRLKAQTDAALTLQHVEQLMQKRIKGDTAPRTVNIQVAVLNRMLTWAEKQRLIPTNPIAQWQPLREVPRRKRRAMHPDEAQALLAVAPLWRQVVYAVLLATGVRRGEMVQLERLDLDLENGVLVVRPELTKNGKGRRVFLPQGLVQLLPEFLDQDVPERLKRQDAFLQRVRGRLVALEESGAGESPTAERLRYLEQVILRGRGHRFLFANGKGLPIRCNCNLLREFRRDLKQARVNPTGLDRHALRHTCNTTLLKGCVNPSITRARLGHTTARMTETYTDKDALDQGCATELIAAFLGVLDGAPKAEGEASGTPGGRGVTMETLERLRPTGAVLAALVDRYSNIVIAKLCRVSEAAVRKWLKAAGIVRANRVIIKDLRDVQLALLRADLRAFLAREAG